MTDVWSGGALGLKIVELLVQSNCDWRALEKDCSSDSQGNALPVRSIVVEVGARVKGKKEFDLDEEFDCRL